VNNETKRAYEGYTNVERLRASHGRLLIAAKRIIANAEHIMNQEWKIDTGAWSELQAAIAAAEEQAP
jgi:hypothetical protein